MVDPSKEVKKSREPEEEGISRDKMLQAVVFGLIFGFLLQKAGVAKYHLLVGVLLFQDFTVIQVMVSAILVGMTGLFILHRLGKVELKIKPTRYGSVILGSLIFGAGFGFSGYCPGTAAAALGQMNWDALFVMAGLVAGSYLFAEASDWLSRTIDKWGDRGKLLLPDLLHLRRPVVLIGFAALLIGGLVLLEKLG
jgi:uncharacterized protein